MTLGQAADLYAMPTTDKRLPQSNFMAGALWMSARILQIINETSCEFRDDRKEVIDQFCDKIYEQLNEIDK